MAGYSVRSRSDGWESSHHPDDRWSQRGTSHLQLGEFDSLRDDSDRKLLHCYVQKISSDSEENLGQWYVRICVYSMWFICWCNSAVVYCLTVTGVVHQGELLAIMGASGAGKTTLLNCLTFRNTGKLKIAGQRNLNGAPVYPDSLARISSYNQQDDLFIGTLTVRELLRFQVLKHHNYSLSLSMLCF